jgi:hypothetical protein
MENIIQFSRNTNARAETLTNIIRNGLLNAVREIGEDAFLSAMYDQQFDIPNEELKAA